MKLGQKVIIKSYLVKRYKYRIWNYRSGDNTGECIRYERIVLKNPLETFICGATSIHYRGYTNSYENDVGYTFTSLESRHVYKVPLNMKSMVFIENEDFVEVEE